MKTDSLQSTTAFSPYALHGVLLVSPQAPGPHERRGCVFYALCEVLPRG